jgi:outer membrane protein assembly factor BamB
MSTQITLIPALTALAFMIGSSTLLARTWTDAKSGKTLEAELVGLKDGKVTLKFKDGKTFELELDRLIADDKAFAEKEAATKPLGGATDWPTWRGTARDGKSPDTGLLKEWPNGGPKLLWTYENAGKGYSSPALVDGKIYLTGSRGGKAEVICLDSSGKELWSAPIGADPGSGYNTGWGGGTRGAPTVSDGMVFAMSANGALASFNAKDGKPLWSKDLVKDLGGKIPGWGYSESPLVDGDKIVVTPGGALGAIAAFDKKTGKELWRSKDLKDDAQYASLIIATVKGKRQYIQLFMNTLAGVDAENGDVIWKSAWPEGRTAVIPTPVYHDGSVYMTSGYGSGCKLVKIDGDKAEDVWENKVMKNHHGGVVLVEGHIYGFSDGGGLVCQEFATGKQKWNKRDEGSQKGSVHYADGMLYCMDEDAGSVFLAEANPDKYTELGRFEIPRQTKLREGTNGKIWAHPVVIGGKLYLRDQDLFFCYDVKR